MERLGLYALMRLRQFTGHSYPSLEKELNRLSPEAQADLKRLADDVHHQNQHEVRRITMNPWRRT